MILKTMQWNIGGGKLLLEGADPTLLKSYTQDGLDEIIEVIRAQDPDIITLQETHSSQNYSQAERIAEALGYKYWFNDEYADSHIEAGQRLGQAVISRVPITEHSFQLFNNPNFEVVWEDGSIAKSHDKGRTSCKVDIGDNTSFTIETFHTIPFRRFKINLDSDEASKVLADMSSKLMVDGKSLIQADFNIDTSNLEELFPKLFKLGFTEVPQHEPTTTRGHIYDHVLAKEMSVIACSALKDVLTDHYPLITKLEI